MGSNACLLDQVIEQAMVGWREDFTVAAWSQDEFANQVLLIGERQPLRRLCWRCVRGGESELLLVLRVMAA